MGKVKKHPPVKLIIGFIFKEGEFLKKAKVFLKKRFGEIDFESQTLPFMHTDYYAKEMGTGLKRKFISFLKLIEPNAIPKIKIISHSLEKRLSSEKRRGINIDPGYVDLAKLILATTKDYRHRIYLNSGVYAEITLFYQDKTFRTWEWTYPDYKTPEYITIFNQIREIYAQQIKED